MHALNSALIHMTVRRVLLNSESRFQAVLSEQRISAADLMKLHCLTRKNFEALDKLPVSLFRISYRTMDVGRSGLDDDVFETATISLSMLMETISFAEKNQMNSLISIGFDMDGFDRFRAEPYLRRLLMINKGGFSLSLRSSVSSLSLIPNCYDSLLKDCIRIIHGDYRYLALNRPKHLGRIRDWNVDMMGPEAVATNLLMDGVTPKLVVAHVGLPERVNSIHRKLRREQSVMPKGGGRIGNHTSAIERLPIHALLFMLLYLMLAAQPISKINGFAFSRSLREYRQICGYLGFQEDDMLDASECWLLASGYRAQEVTLGECRTCKNPMLIDTRKRMRCPWC